MDDAPKVMLLDDGELDTLVPILHNLGVPFLRESGAGAPVAPPLELVIATPRRAPRVRRGSPSAARAGRPLRIIAVEEDSASMRRLLQRLGYHLLVRQPTHDDVWRLLIERALYQGQERRHQDRVPVGSEVSLGGVNEDAFLVDVSNRGCRILSSGELALGASIEVEVDQSRFGAPKLLLPGKIVRAVVDQASNGQTVTSAGVLFDADLEEETRRGLASLLNRFTAGPGSLVNLDPDDALPPTESTEFPGFTLDAETDPAVAANLSVHLSAAEDRRGTPRARFEAPILAQTDQHQRVLLGRDLSAGGMRVEPATDLSSGQRFRLAIYGPGDADPAIVKARVARDDGEEGLVLAFYEVDSELARSLAKIVSCLPGIAGTDDELGSGCVLSAIVGDIEVSA